jgi:hypothetical protein
MSKTTKALLISGIITVTVGAAIATDLIPAGDLSALHILFPCGVILLGLAMLSKVVEKESARYDQEHTTSPGPVAREMPGQNQPGGEKKVFDKPRHA